MKIKFLSAAIILCLAAGQAQAYDFMSGGVAYNVLTNTPTRKTAAVTYVTTEADASGYVTTYVGDITIPSQVSDRTFNTYNVTRIDDLAMFNNQSLYKLTLPEGITAIGSQAFSHCYSLYDINIPSTVTRIADYAFEYCEDLTSITLPARLSMLGDAVFQQCFGLETIEVDPNCVDFKSIDGVLYGNVGSSKGMSLLAYPGSRPQSEFIMPDGVSSIDSYAFSANTTMRSLTLSKEVKDFDMYTFMECFALEEINVAEGNTSYKSDDGVLLTADGKRLVCYPLMRYADEYAVPEGVTTVNPFAFMMTQAVGTLTLPSTLKSIGELAFYYSTSFRNVICKATVPPTFSSSLIDPTYGLFDNAVYAQAILFVPDESVEAYKAAPGWREFAEILPMSTSVSDMTVEPVDQQAEYFNLQGQRVNKPAKGVMLVRRGGKVTKEFMR